MSENLKKETVKGVAWSGIDKIANGGILFIANIILARLLTPKDFGLLAIIAIFIQISQTFIDSGFTNALIQKKDRSQTDYSTVFFFNLAISIGFYVVLFFCAPFIASFFENEKLTSLTRVVGLNLIIGALVSGSYLAHIFDCICSRCHLDGISRLWGMGTCCFDYSEYHTSGGTDIYNHQMETIFFIF